MLTVHRHRTLTNQQTKNTHAHNAHTQQNLLPKTLRRAQVPHCLPHPVTAPQHTLYIQRGVSTGQQPAACADHLPVALSLSQQVHRFNLPSATHTRPLSHF